MADTSDVVIIGGGAAGCAVAYYLAKRGVKATIIEREGIAAKAAGFTAIAWPNDFNDNMDLSAADHIVDDLADFDWGRVAGV